MARPEMLLIVRVTLVTVFLRVPVDPVQVPLAPVTQLKLAPLDQRPVTVAPVTPTVRLLAWPTRTVAVAAQPLEDLLVVAVSEEMATSTGATGSAIVCTRRLGEPVPAEVTTPDTADVITAEAT